MGTYSSIAINAIKARYNSDDIILEALFTMRYGTVMQCPKCNEEVKYRRIAERKSYGCSNYECRNQIYPMKGTIFEGTKTSLVTWIDIMIDLSKTYTSTLEIAGRYLLTYKTAWNICRKIRLAKGSLLDEILSGVVEIDETFLGGKKKLEVDKGKGEHRGKGIGDKDIVFGMLQRKKRLRLFSIEHKNSETMEPLIDKHIRTGTTIHRDGNASYGDLESKGYKPKLVKGKSSKTFLRGTHNNNIEAAWSRLKKKIEGTYVWVSSKHLQGYLDEYCFYYKTKKSMESLRDIIDKLMIANIKIPS